MTDANDRQIGGDHYKQFELDPWDAIAIFCPKNLGGVEIYLWGCAFKYVIRLGSKGSPLEDIEKAEHYLQKLRETLEKKLVDRISAPSVTSHGQGRTVEEMIEGTSQGPKRPPPTPNPRPGYTPTAYKQCDGAPHVAPPGRD